MEAIDFIDSGIAGFLRLPRGSPANIRVEMTKLYRVQLAIDSLRFVDREENTSKPSRVGEAELRLPSFGLSARGAVTSPDR
jgi:hypothetical protein